MLIPIAVVARARELSAGGRDFSAVVRMLAIEGNGTWPRKTLLRRVLSTSGSSSPARGQKSTTRSRPAAPRGAARAVVKTDALDVAIADLEREQAAADARDELSPAALELESMIASEPYDTRLYHELVKGLHAVLGGPCGCYSCGTTKAGA